MSLSKRGGIPHLERHTDRTIRYPSPGLSPQSSVPTLLRSPPFQSSTKFPSTSRIMYRLPFSIRLPAQSLQHGNRQRPSMIPSGITQHPHQLITAAYTVPSQQQAPVGFMDERQADYRGPDNAQHPSRGNPEHQHMAGYQTHYSNENQAHAHAHWRGIGAQQTNAAMLPLSRPAYGHLMSYPALSPTDCAYIHAPMQSPSMHDVRIPTAPSQWTSSRGHQGHVQDYYSSEPTVCSHPAQIQEYQWQQYTSPAFTPPAAAFSLVNDPSSHVQSYFPQADSITFNETPNSGVWPEGSDFHMSTSGNPTSFDQLIWPNDSDGTSERQEPKPSQHPLGTAARKTRAVGYEGDVVLLQQRCRGQGADEGAVVLLTKVFANEVSLEALTRPLTDVEAGTEEFGMGTGKVYTAFLGSTSKEGHVSPRYVCRLCHGGQTWKHSKDVLRHLRRDHFGLAETCKNWCVSSRLSTLSKVLMCFPEYSDERYYTKGEMTRHPCKGIKQRRVAGPA